jgi:RNase P/RNase MRP subunit POP5
MRLAFLPPSHPKSIIPVSVLWRGEGITLTVRDKTGRHRYIGFTVEAAFRPGREDISRALSEAGRVVPGGPLQFNLTVFDGRRGIVKVAHVKKDAAMAALLSVKFAGRDRSPVKVATVLTSGTICTVKERMGIPEGPKPWERKRTAGGTGKTGEPVSR